jgi:hypothetical protein
VPGLRRRRCSARRRYQRGPLKVAQATPWLIDRGDLLAAAQRAVQCPASCNALVIAVPIAPAQAVTTAARPRAESRRYAGERCGRDGKISPAQVRALRGRTARSLSGLRRILLRLARPRRTAEPRHAKLIALLAERTYPPPCSPEPVRPAGPASRSERHLNGRSVRLAAADDKHWAIRRQHGVMLYDLYSNQQWGPSLAMDKRPDLLWNPCIRSLLSSGSGTAWASSSDRSGIRIGRDQSVHMAQAAITDRDDIDPADYRLTGRPDTPRQRGSVCPNVGGPSSYRSCRMVSALVARRRQSRDAGLGPGWRRAR